MLKNHTFLSRIAVLFLGMTLLVSTSSLTEAAYKEESQPAMVQTGMDMQGAEMICKAELETEFIALDDWWNIMRPQMDDIEITVASNKTEETKETEEDMIVTAFGVMDEILLPTEKDSVEEAQKKEAPKKKETKKKDAKKKADILDESLTGGRKVTLLDPVELSAHELDCLQRIVQAEAGNQDIMGKLLVANVVLNRYRSEKFPNSIEKIVTQTHNGSHGLVYQFTPAKPGGNFYTITPDKVTKEAVARAVAGEDYSEGALYFASRRAANKTHMSWFDRKLTRLFQYGNHEFYM